MHKYTKALKRIMQEEGTCASVVSLFHGIVTDGFVLCWKERGRKMFRPLDGECLAVYWNDLLTFVLEF